MFNNLEDKVTASRIEALVEEIRALQLSTREEYLAALSSRINQVISSAGGPLELVPIARESPATLDTFTENIKRLNNDARHFIEQLIAAGGRATEVYNLTAVTQNHLRQTLREKIFGDSPTRVAQDFISDQNLSVVEANLDFQAGHALLPVSSSTRLSFDLSLGPSTSGTNNDLTFLTDGRLDTVFELTGPELDLRLSFDTPTIINQIILELGDYRWVELISFEITDEGLLTHDILSELGAESPVLGPSSGKSSGEVVLDFIPRAARQVKLILLNRERAPSIKLRGITARRREFLNTGRIVSNKMALTGTSKVRFSATDAIEEPYVGVSYQVSEDGVSYRGVRPGTDIDLGEEFYYRVLLFRNDDLFTPQAAIIGQDPSIPSGDGIVSSNTSPISRDVVERTVVFGTVTGVIRIYELVISNTLKIMVGDNLLSANDFSFDNGLLSIYGNQSNVTIIYQTSYRVDPRLEARRAFFSPVVHNLQFQRL